MKLPKSLTTVTTFSKILALLLFFLFIAGSFRLGMKYQRSVDMYQQASSPSFVQVTPTLTLLPTAVSPVVPTTTGFGQQVVIITQQDSDTTVSAKVGDKVLVQLPDMNWDIQLSNTSVLVPIPDGIFYKQATQGRYKVIAPGTVDIIGTGSAKCQGNEVCPQFAIPFRTTVNVLQ